MRFLIALILVFFALPAYAAVDETQLGLRAPSSDIREQQVIDMLAKNGLDKSLPFTVATYDLNADGVNEYFVKQGNSSACEAQADCQFYIAALSERKPVLLAKIKAGKINIRSDSLYGINKLAVYNDPNDDFSAQMYVWKAEISTFLPF